MHPKLIVEQKITPFVNRYSVYAAGADGVKGELLAFAQQKRLAFKEKVIFYKDEEKTQVVFSFRAEKLLDIHGRYFVEDPAGQLIGSFKKDFKKSLLNSTWYVLDANDQSKLMITENNQILALLRRFGGFIPVIGDFIGLALLFFRYHFVISTANTKEVVGKYQKTTLFYDHYLLAMNDSNYADEDWRVLAAMAVGLDALQSR